jgi:hypothetical protein
MHLKMKRTVYFFLLFFFCLLISNATNPNERKKGAVEAPTTSVQAGGIVYSLPRTVVVVTVEARREVFIPGPYAAYAKKYLGYNQAEMQAKTTWTISNVDIELTAEPDPSATFKTFDSIASRVSLLPDGRLFSINSNKSSDAVSLIKRNFITNDAIPRIPFPDLSSNDEYDVLVDPSGGKEKLVGKSLEVKAQEAADYLIRLRKKRAYTILSASDVVPEDGHGYEIFIEEGKRIEKEYVELFMGKSFVSAQKYVFDFIARDKDVKNEVIFSFSDDKGILPKSDVSGRPVVVELSKLGNSFARIQELSKPENPEEGKSGIYYRTPVMGELSITNGLLPLFSARFPLAQFGVIAPLPEQLLDGKYEVVFDAQTGNIKQVNRK